MTRLWPRRVLRASTLALALAGLSIQPALSQEADRAPIPVWTTIGDRPEAPMVQVRDGMLRLGLDDALQVALQENLDLAVERYNRQAARWSVLGNRSIYDLRLNSSLAVSDSQQATASAVVASGTESQSLTTTVSQLTRWGGDASATWENSRSDVGNFDFATINPSFGSDLALSFTQPLLQSFGRLATERGLWIARIDDRISREDFIRLVETVIQDVTTAYLNLIESREQLKVAEESLNLAKELHERNRIQVEVGTKAPLEMVQSEATIATREEEIIVAEDAVESAADRLRRLLNLSDDLWDLTIEPTTDPASERLEIDLESSLETALAERHEMRRQELSIERQEIEAKFQRNQKKPRFDVTVRYGLNGLGGSGKTTDPDTGEEITIDTDLSDAIEQVLNRDFDRWSVNLTFNYPLQNRAAKANAAVAELTLEQARVAKENLSRQIVAEVRAAVRGVATAGKQIDSARASRRLQEKNLEAEQKRYENGMATSFQVAEIQEDVTDARRREVASITNYRVALVEYYRSIGQLLEQTRVNFIDEAE